MRSQTLQDSGAKDPIQAWQGTEELVEEPGIQVMILSKTVKYYLRQIS